MTPRQVARSALDHLTRRVGWPLSAAWARLMAMGLRPPAFVGAFSDHETALANVPRGVPGSYDDDLVAPINFEAMCALQLWDYPVLFWLERLLAPGAQLLDAGGHFGTKYIAFRTHIDLTGICWQVYDLPATIRAAKDHQARGSVPEEVDFTDRLATAATPDILLVSGLLQYLDTPFADLISALPQSPRHLLLNKVATTDGPTVVTLEKIGPGRVPYQIRNRARFEASLTGMGYVIRDQWRIPSLARRIATHPQLGASVSRGYLLERVG